MAATENNKIEYGIEKIKIWPIETETGDEITYSDKSINWPGAVSLKLTALGDTTNIHADNSAYITIVANNGFEGEMESYQLPEEVALEILGQIKDSNGALIEKSDARIKSFGMAYEFIGDKKNARIFAPYCSLTQRPGDEKTTKGESVEPGAYVFNFNMAPRLSDKVVRIKLYEGSPAYATFFEKPYEVKFDEVVGG